MASIHTAPATGLHVGLLVLRLATGAVFIGHGYQKLFESGIAGTAQGFAGMGVPLPQVVAPVISVLEFAGGIALIVGVLTRIVAALLAIDMLGAMFIVHLPNGFFLPSGIEFVLMLCAAAVTLALAGPGAYSTDVAARSRRTSVP